MKSPKILAITLARKNSKGIPFKNSKSINGKSLIRYTVDEVKKSKYIDRYIISTDDMTIEFECPDVEIFRRSPVNSRDTSKSSDALLEVINSDIQYKQYDYIIEIMATNPLKTVDDIDGVIEETMKNDRTSGVSVVRIYDNHPSRVKYIEDNMLKDFYPEIPESRRQDLTPAAYVRNGSMYITKTEFLLKEKKRVSEDCYPYIMSQENTINIDESIDLLVAEFLIKQRVMNEKDK